MSIRSRSYACIIYPDDVMYPMYLEGLCTAPDWWYILHNADTGKKPHVHVVVSYDNARSLDSVASSLGMPSNMLEPVKSLPAALRYLVHADDADKHQYPLSAVVSSTGSFALPDKRASPDSMDDALNDIVCAICSGECPDIRSVWHYAYAHGLSKVVRCNAYLINLLLRG